MNKEMRKKDDIEGIMMNRDIQTCMEKQINTDGDGPDWGIFCPWHVDYHKKKIEEDMIIWIGEDLTIKQITH